MENARDDKYLELKALGLDHEWVDNMLAAVSQSRSALWKSLGAQDTKAFLLTLGPNGIDKFQAAVGTFSMAAREWLVKVAMHLVEIAEKEGEAPPSFTLCGFGSFGRGEMAPFSDLDTVALCSEADLGKVDGFMGRLFKAIRLMRQLQPEGLAQIFSATPDAGLNATTPKELAAKLKTLGTTPDVWSIWEHQTKVSFVLQYYKHAESHLEGIQKTITIQGLDGLFNMGIGYNAYLKPKVAGTTKYNLKTIVSFFQRAMAMRQFIEVRQNSQSNQDVPNATATRIERYANWNVSKVLYFQVLAVRYANHFARGEEADDVSDKEGGKFPEMFKRIIDLNEAGLSKELEHLDGKLKGYK